MRINNKSKSIIKTKKTIRSKSSTIYLSRNNINTSNNFKDSSIINFKKFNNLFSNRFENFL